MAQNATIVPEGSTTVISGAALIAALNAAHKTLSTHHFGTTDPATDPLLAIDAGSTWWDATANPAVEKVRNATNSAWVLTGRDITGAVAAGSALATALAAKLPLAGGTLTNYLTLHADPASAMQAATKQYVDAVARPAPVRFMMLGNASVRNGVAYALIEQNASLVELMLRAFTAPVGAALTCVITRIRESVADSTRSISLPDGDLSVALTLVSPLALLKGDVLRWDITQTGVDPTGGNPLLCVARLVAP